MDRSHTEPTTITSINDSYTNNPPDQSARQHIMQTHIITNKNGVEYKSHPISFTHLCNYLLTTFTDFTLSPLIALRMYIPLGRDDISLPFFISKPSTEYT